MADWTKAQLLADIASLYLGVGTPVNPPANGTDPEGAVNGVTKYLINVNEYGASEQNRKPTGYRKTITFYVYHEGLGDEKAWYERLEPVNTSDGNVAISTSSYEAIAKLYNSKFLQDRVLAAIISQCSSIFQESVTSVTSLAIGTGSKSLTVTTGYPAGTVNFTYGQQLVISNGANSMTGNVTSYTQATGVLVVNVTSVTGSGTFASWTVIPTNHNTRMKLVKVANQSLPLVVMQMMSSIAINTTVQTGGTAVTDATIQGIIAGSWDSYAGLTELV